MTISGKRSKWFFLSSRVLQHSNLPILPAHLTRPILYQMCCFFPLSARLRSRGNGFAISVHGWTEKNLQLPKKNWSMMRKKIQRERELERYLRCVAVEMGIGIQFEFKFQISGNTKISSFFFVLNMNPIKARQCSLKIETIFGILQVFLSKKTHEPSAILLCFSFLHLKVIILESLYQKF